MSKVRLAVLSVMVLLATSAVAMADSFMFSFSFGRPVYTYVEYGYSVYAPPVVVYEPSPVVVYEPSPVVVYRPVYRPIPVGYVYHRHLPVYSHRYWNNHHGHRYGNPGPQIGPRHHGGATAGRGHRR